MTARLTSRAERTNARDGSGTKRPTSAPAPIVSGSRTASWATSTPARNTNAPPLRSGSVRAPTTAYAIPSPPKAMSTRRAVLTTPSVR
ncbi:hypothetical protein OWR29_01850 [Actinoplanes sp. Pm04-4]|uniref:Uncharacterized protein n=1 Tax=Paractinoplanes pyxinae TaxID=2997416 RepID=A0ABT4ATP9_9ACTN|nr:hypothetical protein [Actinoplanes pyxinae]MCY1136723.1 hypothetical protein [Actinoplanes pyxinae]